MAFSPSGVFDHLMMLEKAEAVGLQRHQKEHLEELRTTAATLRAKRDRIRAETSKIKVFNELLYKHFQLMTYLCC